MRRFLQNFREVMKLSIIIVNYNTKDITLDCLISIDRFPVDGKFEVIVVDNASTDNSIDSFEKLRVKNYKLKVIKNDYNSGFSKANNIGIKSASGEYIFLLNSDTRVLKNSINELMDFAQTHKNVGIVAPKLLNGDNTAQPSVFKLPTLARTIRQYWLGEAKLTDKYVPQDSSPVSIEAAVGAALLFTPAGRKKAGLLDERYFMYFEDFDYCRKARAKGLKIYYLPSAKIIHIHGASGVSSLAQRDRLIASSKIYHGVLGYYLLTLIIKIGSKLGLVTK